MEEIAELNRADQDRLDRMPTQAERRVGLVLSGFLTLIFSCCAAFVLMRAQCAEANRGELVTFGGILAAIGLVGGFFFYRFAFTAPMTSSPRAHNIYVSLAVAVTVALTAGTLFLPATTAQRTGSLTLLIVALTMFARARKKGGRD